MKHDFWDFKKYDEKGWFRFLVISLFIFSLLYITGHIISNLYVQQYNYEYTTLSVDKMKLVNQMYADTPAAEPKVTSTMVMQYLNNTFNGKLAQSQSKEIEQYLSKTKPAIATAFLAVNRFKIESYFWLIGPFVYLEIVFWAIFGVLGSLLFNLGVVGKNSTTTIANPQSVFDASEIPYQVAKILYSPLCTLAVILGYNYFKDQSIVDISSGKGVIPFSFICGFYSSRLISLMDRLKEIVLPNSGTATVPGNATPVNVPQINKIVIKK